MITVYEVAEGKLRAVDSDAMPSAETLRRGVWIDLDSPTAEEDAAIKAALAVDIPTRDEMEEIETSSRLYTDETAAFMTAMLPALNDVDNPDILPVSFVLSGERLITVRYHEPRAFQAYVQRTSRMSNGCHDGLSVLAGLLDAVVDRIADILELAGQGVDTISRDIFPKATTGPAKGRDFQSVLRQIGRRADLLSIIRDSLATFDRLFSFLANVAVQKKADKDTRARIKTLSRDVTSLIDHASFLSQKITFLLDATLGMISIEQNAIIKIFSVAAVIFLPPTLVASVYGMNFEFMPELSWRLGYPYALALMVVSAVIPYLFFKRRGWL
ncbi:magnesium transporter CorA family protein [Pararhizobium haloflavum]|uniref:magnesium transporter CorA family protein n=1 Tax=Pararhizobium haloflavum TaxID=2037914 RepID=UPI000C1896EE|nr:magnesium transporter CorA family protein [Pararhizobium haloflavum]